MGGPSVTSEPNNTAVCIGAFLLGTGLCIIHPGLLISAVGAVTLWFQFSKP